MVLSQLLPRRMRWLSFQTGRDVRAAWLAFVVGTLFIVAAAWQAEWSQGQQADGTASRLAEAVAKDVGRSLEQLDLTLRTVIGGDRTPANKSLTPLQRNELLSERMPRDRYLDFVDILDVDGNVVASSTPTEPPRNWSNQEYFAALRRNATTDLYVGRPFATEYESRVGFTISRPITDSDGKFAGLVVMGVRLALLRDLFGRHELGPDDSVALLRDDGVVLARTPFELKDVGHPIELTSPFYAFQRTGNASLRASDQTGDRRFEFRRIGTLPLVVSVATPTEASYSSPELWMLVAAIVALATAFSLMMHQLHLRQQQCEAAEQKSQEKTRFLTTLSHDLRTLLHGMLGYAEQLSRETELPVTQARQIAEIFRAAKRMRDTVNVVLDYARVEAQRPTLYMQKLDVRQLVEDCMAVIEPAARARGLETRCTVAPGAPTHFVTDDAKLRQILGNLLHNAVKYTPSGVVELRLAGDAELLTIEVADTGIGIPEGRRHRLFKDFERFGAERTSIEGTGLGLAIANRLVQRLRGGMGHRDNPGGGSVFWLKLPAGFADASIVTADQATAVPAGALRILVVDDSDVNRNVAEAFLRDAGHRVTAARDGSEAVRRAVNQDFDVVLMDMLMPEQDGLEVTRRIRAIEGPRGRVPIVAMTANALDQHAEECRHVGMSEYLAKPFTQAELLAVVARAAAQRPRATCGTAAVVDPDCVTQLTASIGPDAVEQLFHCLELRVEALLRALENPVGLMPEDSLAGHAHELAGSAGTLGFIGLAAAADRFLNTIKEDPGSGGRWANELRRHAIAALAELRRRRALEAMLST